MLMLSHNTRLGGRQRPFTVHVQQTLLEAGQLSRLTISSMKPVDLVVKWGRLPQRD